MNRRQLHARRVGMIEASPSLDRIGSDRIGSERNGTDPARSSRLDPTSNDNRSIGLSITDDDRDRIIPISRDPHRRLGIVVMKSKRPLILIASLSIIVFIAVANALALRSRRVGDGQIVVEPDLETRLSADSPGKIAEGVYQLQNHGDKPVDFKIQAWGQPASISPSEGTLEPGEIRAIRYGVRLTSIKDQAFVTLAFTSNEPGNPTITRIVRGEIPSPFEFDPSSIQFGRLKPAVKQSKTLAVKVKRGGIENVHVIVDYPSIHVDRLDSAGSTIRYGVDLTLGENDPTSGRIVFRSSEGVEDSVLVTGEIHRPVIVAPPIVYLKAKADDASTLVGTVIVSLTDDDDLGELQDQADGVVHIVESIRTDRRRRLLTVEIKRDAIKEGERLKRIFRYSKLDRDLSIELVRNR